MFRPLISAKTRSTDAQIGALKIHADRMCRHISSGWCLATCSLDVGVCWRRRCAAPACDGSRRSLLPLHGGQRFGVLVLSVATSLEFERSHRIDGRRCGYERPVSPSALSKSTTTVFRSLRT